MLTHTQAPRWALSEHLRYFCGLVAVGTNTGHVILIGKYRIDQTVLIPHMFMDTILNFLRIDGLFMNVFRLCPD